jgi:ribosome-associated protein
VDDADEDAELRSRGDATRERQADEKRLAALALALTSLSSKQLSKLDLEEGVADAVAEARRLPSRRARARQLRIVRRELRGCDSVAIATAVDDLLNPDGRPTAAQYGAKLWADRFVTEGNDAVEGFLAEHEHADRQRLKGLLRNVRKADAAKAAKARKTLIAALQAVIQEAAN